MTKPTSAPSALVGTWRSVSVDGHPAAAPNNIRYYEDGTYAWWPAVRSRSSRKTITYGRYHLKGNYLVQDTTQRKKDSKTRVQIEGNELTIIDNESGHLLYKRVIPDLEPGQVR